MINFALVGKYAVGKICRWEIEVIYSKIFTLVLMLNFSNTL